MQKYVPNDATMHHTIKKKGERLSLVVIVFISRDDE